MKTRPRQHFACLGLCLLTVGSSLGTASARRHAPPWTAPADAPEAKSPSLPTEPTPLIDPDAAPSLSLEPFLHDHLDKMLPPLGTAAFEQTDLIAAVRATYAKAVPTATEARKPAYVLALAVCDAMTVAIGEREKAVEAMNGAYERRRSEAIQPRGGREAVKDSDKDEAFFYESQKNTWNQNAAGLRQQVLTVYHREQAAEAQAGGPWTPPPPSGVVPSVSVPAPVVDPVIGDWKWDGYLNVTLKADHTMGSKRHGSWALVASTDNKRHYEFHYSKHLDWADTLILSDDGRSMEGSNKYGKYVSAQRQ